MTSSSTERRDFVQPSIVRADGPWMGAGLLPSMGAGTARVTQQRRTSDRHAEGRVAQSTSGFTWDDVKYVLAVVRTGSFAEAARDLEVDPATVSRRVAAFEGAIGRKVFERSPGRYSSVSVLKDAEDILDMALLMESSAERMIQWATAADIERQVRVKASDAVTNHLLTPVILRQPTGPFQHTLDNLPQIPQDVVEFVDINSPTVEDIRIDHLPHPATGPGRDDWITRKITTVTFVPLMTDAYAARHSEPASFRDLAAHRLATMPLFGLLDREDAFAPWLRVVRLNQTFCFNAPNVGLAEKLALQGDAIALLPSYMRHCHPALRTPNCDIPPMRVELWATAPREALQVALVRQVFNVLITAIEAAALG